MGEDLLFLFGEDPLPLAVDHDDAGYFEGIGHEGLYFFLPAVVAEGLLVLVEIPDYERLPVLHHPSGEGPVQREGFRLIEALRKGDGGSAGEMVVILDIEAHRICLVDIEDKLDERVEAHDEWGS